MDNATTAHSQAEQLYTEVKADAEDFRTATFQSALKNRAQALADYHERALQAAKDMLVLCGDFPSTELPAYAAAAAAAPEVPVD